MKTELKELKKHKKELAQKVKRFVDDLHCILINAADE